MISKHIYKKQGIKLNYYEITNSLQPLVLIHAQGVDATSFKNVWGRLSEKYHVYSIDCYGHGESLHNAEQYNVEDIGNAIIRFDCGHGIHIEKPKEFTECLIQLRAMNFI